MSQAKPAAAAQPHELLDQVSALIGSVAQECLNNLHALHQLHVEMKTDPEKQRGIYQGVADNVKRALDKLKDECSGPIQMWRTIRNAQLAAPAALPGGTLCYSILYLTLILVLGEG